MENDGIDIIVLMSYYKEPPTIKSHNPLKFVFWDHVTNQKRFISTTTIPKATKVSIVVA